MSRPLIFTPICFCFIFILAVGQSSHGAMPSDQLLPNTTKAYVSSPNLAEAAERFDETQFGHLINDPVMQPFIDDLRSQLKGKMTQAGMRMGITLKDLKGIRAGEITVATIQPGGVKTQHASALVVDVTGNVAAAQNLLQTVAGNQVQKGAQRTSQKQGNVELTVLAIPRRENPGTFNHAIYFVHQDILLATDHLGTAQEIAKRLAGDSNDSLSSLKAFTETMDRCEKAANGTKPNVRWFIEPIGYAETVKASNAKKKRGRDMLKVLVSQGFDAIQGIGGHVTFKTDSHDVLHRTFVYGPAAKGALPGERFKLAARMLNFPNKDNLAPLDWVPRDLSMHLSLNFKVKEAFDYVGSLVDEAADAPGVWEDILKGLESDPNGPRINIRKELLAHAGERITLLSDYRLPITPKSERLAVAIEVTNEAAVAKAIRKIMESDPNANRHTIDGREVWEIISEEQAVKEEDEPTIEIEGAGFTSTTGGKKMDDDDEKKAKPIIPNWAATVVHGHLLVATHLDFVKELLKMPSPENRLSSSADYQLVRDELTKLGAGSDSFRLFSRTDEAYRPTYELLKQGKMPQSETLFGKLLNRILAPEDDGELRKQEIDGAKLPDYAAVRRYFGPSGLYVRSETDGWMVTGCLLTKEAEKK